MSILYLLAPSNSCILWLEMFWLIYWKIIYKNEREGLKPMHAKTIGTSLYNL